MSPECFLYSSFVKINKRDNEQPTSLSNNQSIHVKIKFLSCCALGFMQFPIMLHVAYAVLNISHLPIVMLVGHAIVLVYVNMVFKGQKKSFSLKSICG